MAAAQGILLSCAKEKLAEYGGHINLYRHCASLLLQRMNFVKQKATTAKSEYCIENFAKAKETFLESMTQKITMEEEIPQNSY